MSRLLVHLHVYYPEQLPWFVEKLSHINGCEWDLYVTCSREEERIRREKEEKERQEREAKEELRKQYEASASFMTAYSSEQVPDIPDAPAPEATASPEVPAPAPAAPA